MTIIDPGSDADSDSVQNGSERDQPSIAKRKRNRNIPKNPVGHLPKELLRFVENNSYSLLVKGKPGTGKTTFALTLMDNLKADGNYFFISTRLSVKQLYYYYPWINKFTSTYNAGSEYKFEDARLDEPESLFERITNQLMDVKSPIIIIDSWDIIASFMDRESRLNNERVLQIWRERAGAKLIFLSESYDTGILDSIVDGIITLKREVKSNTVRNLFINKLRGISINCSKYYFSLYNGFFYVFDSYTDLNALNDIVQKKYGSKSVIKRKNINKSTAEVKNTFHSFQNMISRKNFIVMEFDPLIDTDMILPIVMKPLLMWLNSNKKIQINNSKWSFIQRFNLFLEQLSNNTGLKNNVLYNNKIFSQEGNSDDLDYIDNRVDPITNEKLSMTPGNTINGNNILNVIEIEKINGLFSDFKIIETLKNKYLSNLLITRKPSKDVNQLLFPQSIYYKVFLKGKNILIKTINPIGPTYGTLIENEGCLINWIPIN